MTRCRKIVLPLALIALIACSGGSQTLRAECSAAPMSGLFEVTGYSCENPLREVEACPVLRYLEIAPREADDNDEPQRMITYWYAGSPESSTFSSQVWVFEGRCTQDGRFALDGVADGQASLRMKGQVPVAYDFVSYTVRQPRQLMFEVHASLRRVTRNPELDARLPRVRE
jgi:hypothetical protein